MYGQRELVRESLDAPRGQSGRAIPPHSLSAQCYTVRELEHVPTSISTRPGVFWTVRAATPGPEPGTTCLMLWPLGPHTVEAHEAVDLPGGVLR